MGLAFGVGDFAQPPCRSYTALTHVEAIKYLLSRGLLDSSAFVNDDLTSVDISRRNRNFKISRNGGPGFFLKQDASLEGLNTIAREGAFYNFVHSNLAGEAVVQYLVRCYGYDKILRVLVLELADNSLSLDEYQLQSGRFPTHLASEIGRALGALHRETRVLPQAEMLPELLPWVLSIHTPLPPSIRDVSGATVQILKIIHGSNELCALLDALRLRWHASSMIHGDVKSTNCIVLRSRTRKRARPRLKLIDWELAARGDPAWDVGSMFQDYLAAWINSIPVIGSDSPERFIGLARHPIDKLQPPVRAFWRAYKECAEIYALASQEFLLRSVAYAAARLIQTTYEQGLYQSQLAGTSIYALQVSLNILQHPHEALVHLLGLPLYEPENPTNDYLSAAA
jgi:hypothetical protein